MTTHLSELYDEPPAGKDYILQVKVRNGPLLRAMRIRGYFNASQLAVASGVQQNTVGYFLALRYPPINRKGEWLPSALKLAKFLRLPPDSLWPEQHLENALKVSTGEMEISREEVSLLMPQGDILTPEQQIEREEMLQALTDALTKLPARQERLLRLRFGLDGGKPKSLDDTAYEFGVTRERIRQIEAKAIRALRHPRINRSLWRRLKGEPSRLSYTPTHHPPWQPLVTVEPLEEKLPQEKLPSNETRSTRVSSVSQDRKPLYITMEWAIANPPNPGFVHMAGSIFFINEADVHMVPKHFKELGRQHSGDVRIVVFSRVEPPDVD